MESDFSISLTVCGRQHFFISFFTLKKARRKRFSCFQRDTKIKNLREKLPVVLREFYFLMVFRNRLGDITSTKTLTENIGSPLYIEKSAFSYLRN